MNGPRSTTPPSRLHAVPRPGFYPAPTREGYAVAPGHGSIPGHASRESVGQGACSGRRACRHARCPQRSRTASSAPACRRSAPNLRPEARVRRLVRVRDRDRDARQSCLAWECLEGVGEGRGRAWDLSQVRGQSGGHPPLGGALPATGGFMAASCTGPFVHRCGPLAENGMNGEMTF